MPTTPLSVCQDDLELFALCIWREARGEGSLGMTAVGWVIRNRIGSPGFPHTLRDVILERNQFTSMTVPSDPEYRLAPEATDPSWAEAYRIAASILAGECPDPTRGARYYWNPRTAHSEWFRREIAQNPQHSMTAEIGRQQFFS